MPKASGTIDHANAKVQDGKTLSEYNFQKESSVLQDINEVHGVAKKLGVEDRSHRDGRTRGPDWPDFSACTVAKSTTLTNFPKRDDVQWMMHTISRD